MVAFRLGVGVVAVWAGVTLTGWAAAEPPKLPPGVSSDDPRVVAVNEAQAKVDRLREGPVIKQLEKIGQQRAAAEDEHRRVLAPLETQAQPLWESPEMKAYQEATQSLYAAQNALDDLAHERLQERMAAIYTARHEELRQLAGKECPAARAMGMDVLNYPRLDGSTSTRPLATIVCARIFSTPYAWVYGRSYGRFAARDKAQLFLPPQSMPGAFYHDPHDDELTLAELYPQARFEGDADGRLAAIINNLLVRNTGTHTAYVNLIKRQSDLALLARKPADDELAAAKAAGVELLTTPIAWDALVFIVNQKNPVRDLTRDQVRGIYSEKIASWQELGGPDLKLVPFRRERNSGSQELLEELLLDGRPLPDVPANQTWQRTLMASGMGGPFSRLTNEQNGIAFSVYYYEHFMAASPYTRVLSIDGVEPSAATIASGKYRLRAPVYAVYRKGDPADGKPMQLLNWLLSDEGQRVVRESGYVSVKP